MKENNILNFLLSILIGLFVFFVGINVQSEEAPNRIYKVYLNGQTLGLIESKEELLNLIDSKQDAIKNKYGVDKVYPPSGLEIREEYTYSNDIQKVEVIYDLIQDQDPFTIPGYTVTIKYPADSAKNEIEQTTEKENRVLYILNKSDFEEGFKTVVKAFIGSDKYDLYVNESQPEIVDVGSKIETIYWDETITIKESYISVDSEILTSAADISKYLFYGTLDEQKTYAVKEGDDIDSIAAEHNLNTDEFLVANPQFASRNVLLTPNQKVSVGLIEPIVTITAEIHLVEDIVNKFKVEYTEDPKSYYGTQTVTQEGSNGVSRVTEKILYKNGEIHNLVIASSQEITPVVNKVIARGSRGSGGQYYNSGGNDEWSWPTISPFVITSRFAPRWGSFHSGIDISGTGYGSPIRAVQDGIIIRNDYSGNYGYMVAIDHQNGYVTVYAHMVKKGNQPVGTKVTREQVIGYMGSSGFSTGTHLHLEVIPGSDFAYKGQLDPCNSIFKC